MRPALYVPNLIDYLRFLFILLCWYYIDVPKIFLPFYAFQAILDFFDGYFARKLNQATAFGAWLDVVIDNMGRGILWCHVSEYGYFITMIEWLTFSCTHSHGAFWKKIFSDQPSLPFFVRSVMANGFKTKIGFISIAGLHCLPIWLYCLANMQFFLLGSSISTLTSGAILIIFIIGRLLCMIVELWIIFKHMENLLSEEKQN